MTDDSVFLSALEEGATLAVGIIDFSFMGFLKQRFVNASFTLARQICIGGVAASCLDSLTPELPIKFNPACEQEKYMGKPKMSSSFSESTEPIELHALGGILRFGTAHERNTYVEDASTDTLTRRIRTMAHNNKQIINAVKAPSSAVTETPAAHLNDVLVAGATAMTDIENVINELQAARDYLQAEAERLWSANACYANLAKAASDSAKSIADSMGKWRNSELLGVPSSFSPPKASESSPVRRPSQTAVDAPLGLERWNGA
jgi:hypothetical protein